MNNRKLSFLLPFRCVIFVLIFAIGSLITGKALADLSSIWSVVASLVNILTILLLVVLTKKTGGYAKLINYQKGKTRPKQVIGMTLPIMVGHAIIDVATVAQILATSAIPGFYEMMCAGL